MSSPHTASPAQPTVYCLMGPTASGKTRVALALAEQADIEIVSVDSALVYRGLDIGSGKPDAATLKRVPHHLVDIRDPSQPYSAAEFRSDALQAIAQILAAGKTPLLVGGTMLYFKVLRDGLAAMPEADPALRARLLQEAHTSGWEALHQRLQSIDPATAARILPSDTQRLQRALEVFELSGRPLSDFHEQQQTPSLPFHLHFSAIYPQERATLHGLIRQRLLQMLADGFVEEVRALYLRGDLSPQLPAIRSVGYRQVWDYLDGVYVYDEMVAKALAATRQLAKRQLTWLRNWPELNIFDSEDSKLVEKYLKNVAVAPISVP